MLKYRIILKVGYNEVYFDFDTIVEAGDFAKDILTHQVDSEDTKKRGMIRLEIIDPSITEGDDDYE